MKPHRTPAFFRAWALIPHTLVGRAIARATRLSRPRRLVRGAIDAWIRRGHLDLRDFEPGPYPTVEAFFLRRLRAGARPQGPGITSPVDGVVVGQGPIGGDTVLLVKGHPLSVDRLVNGRLLNGRLIHGRPDNARLDTRRLHAGTWTTIFLTPDGYHHVHMPMDAEVVDVRWLPGRQFPQNADALRHIPRIYERNERAILRLRTASGAECLLIMVGASLIGGIHLHGVPQSVWQTAWRHRAPHPIGRRLAKGDPLGWFSFGSTVVLLAPPGLVERVHVRPEQPLRLGQPLWSPAPGPRRPESPHEKAPRGDLR